MSEHNKTTLTDVQDTPAGKKLGIKVAKITTLLAGYDTETNLKSKGKKRKLLEAYAVKDPEAFKLAGGAPELFPSMRTEVREFGCRGKMILVDDLNQPITDSPISIQDVMRAKHEYYNMLLKAWEPCFKQATALLISGPKWTEAVALQGEIKALCEKRNQLYFQRMKLSERKKLSAQETEKKDQLTKEHAEVSAALKLLYDERKKPLQKELWAELNAKRKEHKAELAALTSTGKGTLMGAAQKATRRLVSPGNTPGGREPTLKNRAGVGLFLYVGDYAEVENAAKASFDASLEFDWVDQAKSHYRYESRDGKHPDNILTWEKWDGVGTVTVVMTEKDRPTLVRDAHLVNGKSVQVRPLRVEDLPHYDLPENFLGDRKELTRRKRIATLEGVATRTENQERALRELRAACDRGDASDHDWVLAQIQLQKSRSVKGIQVQKGVWISVPTKLHRELSVSEDNKIAAASFLCNKIGRELVTSFHVTVKRDRVVTTNPDGEVTVRVCNVKTDQGVQVAHLQGKNEKESAFYLPSMVGARLEESDRIHGYVKEHLSLAIKTLEGLSWTHPTLDADFDFKGRSSIRYAYRTWKEHLCTKFGRETATLRMRQVHEKIREDHAAVKSVGGSYNGSYQNSHDMVTVELLQHFDLTRSEAEVLAALTLFVERFDHLYPWAVNLREKALSYRREEYRKLAARLARQYSIINLAKGSAPSRGAKDFEKAGKLVAASILEGAIKNAADREGVKLVIVK